MNNQVVVLDTKPGDTIESHGFQINIRALIIENSKIIFIFDSENLKKFLLMTFIKTSRDKVQSNNLMTNDTEQMTLKNCILKIRQFFVILHLNANIPVACFPKERHKDIISIMDYFLETCNNSSKNSSFFHLPNEVCKKNFDHSTFLKTSNNSKKGNNLSIKEKNEYKLKKKLKSINCKSTLNNLQRFNIYEYIV